MLVVDLPQLFLMILRTYPYMAHIEFKFTPSFNFYFLDI